MNKFTFRAKGYRGNSFKKGTFQVRTLAPHYGEWAVREARAGRARNAERYAQVAAHHALESFGRIPVAMVQTLSSFQRRAARTNVCHCEGSLF